MRPTLRFNERFDDYGINRKIVKRKTRRGDYGLFANEPIAKGEIIYFEDDETHYWDEVVLTVEELAELREEEFRVFWCYGTQRGINQFSGPLTFDSVTKDIGYFMNHSCDPTCWYIHDEAMEARRDIDAGDEITYDYSTSDIHRQYFECGCGAPNCRKRITEIDWRLMKSVYGDHYLNYINELEKQLVEDGEKLADYLKYLNDLIKKIESSFLLLP